MIDSSVYVVGFQGQTASEECFGGFVVFLRESQKPGGVLEFSTFWMRGQSGIQRRGGFPQIPFYDEEIALQSNCQQKIGFRHQRILDRGQRVVTMAFFIESDGNGVKGLRV